MADKLSISDLRRAVMVRTGATEQEVNAFHNALKEQIVEALRRDKQVKINGLGTFRLQAIAPRKSVNIATGESITIEGYNKLAFVPEVSIKELVGNNPLQEEQPTPQPQAPKKNADNTFDPLKKLGEQADEIVDILATIGQGPKAEQPAESVEPEPTPTENIEDSEKLIDIPTESESPSEQPVEQPAIEIIEPKGEQETPVSQEPVIQPIEPQKDEQAPAQESPSVEVGQPQIPAPKLSTIEVIKADEKAQTRTSTQSQVEEKKAEKKAKDDKPKKKYHFLRDTLICVGCLLLLLVGGFFFLRESLSNWVNSLNKPAPIEDTQVVVPIDTVILDGTTDSIIEPIKDTISTELIYNEFIAVERVRDGSRLAQIARRHYGDDKIDLWVYIYDANKEQLSNPNDIKVGTELRIPKLTEQQMDLTNPDTQAQIQELKAQIEARTK